MKKVMAVAAFAAALGFAGQAAADDAHMKKSAGHGAMQAAGEMTEGEVRKVDKESGKLTLRHGEIKNLEMPPMTMVFRVSEPALLDGLKPGDKVRFTADQQGGGMRVTRIERLK